MSSRDLPARLSEVAERELLHIEDIA